MAQSSLPLIILGIIALATYNLADPKKSAAAQTAPATLTAATTAAIAAATAAAVIAAAATKQPKQTPNPP